ncbi:MAG: response regulator [Kiritimatiellaceae bacterium]|nr:response regulator [Kiritimatiellaceae bacterium]
MKHILIVDDDLLIQRLFTQFFTAEGYSTAVADNGLAAILQISTKRPDLIITDVVMPGMDGLALIREVRKSHPDIPMIAISGGQRAVAVNFQPHAEKDGAHQFLEKPVSLSTLLISVQRLLDQNHPA